MLIPKIIFIAFFACSQPYLSSAQCIKTNLPRFLSVNSSTSSMPVTYTSMDLVEAQNANYGDMFLIGGQFNDSLPYFEFMSVQGIQFWSKYINNSTLNSVQSIKYVNASPPYFFALFNTPALTIGKFIFNKLSVNTLFTDPSSSGKVLTSTSMIF